MPDYCVFLYLVAIAKTGSFGSDQGPGARLTIAHDYNLRSRTRVRDIDIFSEPFTNATLTNLSRLYEAGHAIDQHRDMRLDIDSMTYEELVALEEQIGDVNTGLKESYIQENLRSSFYVPRAAYMSDQSSVENDACIICQEEYKATELVGTLDCGHRYHAMCIKQWLMVKNVCPICKTTALSADRRNG